MIDEFIDRWCLFPSLLRRGHGHTLPHTCRTSAKHYRIHYWGCTVEGSLISHSEKNIRSFFSPKFGGRTNNTSSLETVVDSQVTVSNYFPVLRTTKSTPVRGDVWARLLPPFLSYTIVSIYIVYNLVLTLHYSTTHATPTRNHDRRYCRYYRTYLLLLERESGR